jgi:hypothetical protein
MSLGPSVAELPGGCGEKGKKFQKLGLAGSPENMADKII